MIKSPHPALDLSFMCPRKVGGGILYWNVETTGSYGTDCERGRKLGEEFLAYIGKNPTNGNATLLGCIVLDMADHPAKGLKLGFMAAVNEYSMGVARLIHGPAPEPSPVRHLIDEYRQAEKAFRVAVNNDHFPDDAPEWKAKEALEDALIAAPCATLGDVREKARLALADENVFDSLTNCRIGDEHVQTIFLRSLLGEEA